MKKVNVFFTGVVILLLSISINAQAKTGADYFEGKWDVVVKGTPSGDAQMLLTLENVDGKPSGTISLDAQSEPQKLSSVTVSENSLTVYFSASGYDVFLTMKIIDDDHIDGTMMGMFTANGVRNIE